MRKYTTALFDLDGTLVHTERQYYITVMNKAINDLGLKPVPDSLIDRFWEEMDKISFAQEYFNVSIETIWDTLRKYENLDFRLSLTKAYDDVAYLQQLREKGLRLGLVTGASDRICKIECSLLPITFDTIVLARPTYGIGIKPDPQGLYVALDNLGSRKENAFYVGNATEDVLAAKAAGMLDIAIERGEYRVNAKPTKWIKSLYDLEAIINNP